MNTLKENIINQKLEKVIYTELNYPKRQIFHSGFDTFDFGINLIMKNGFCWNLTWKDNEYFELGTTFETKNKHIRKEEIVNFDASQTWKSYFNHVIKDVKFYFIDQDCIFLNRVCILLDNDQKINIVIGEELNLDNSIPCPLNYRIGGHLYVFHNEELFNNKFELGKS